MARGAALQRWNELDKATHDPPLSRLVRLREAPASIRRVRSLGRGAGRGSAITAVFLPCSNSLARHTSAFFISYRVHYLSLRPTRTRCSLRRASPHRPLFYCQPTILTCARNVRRSTKVFMEISFRMRLARLLTRERQYKSTITNGRVN